MGAILAITRHAHPRPSLAHAALWSLRAAVGLPSGGLGHSASHLAAVGLPLLGVGVVASAMAILLRPRAEGVLRHPGDDDRARQIVERYGSDTLAYFALRDDKSHFVHGDVLVAYRQLWNVALVSGDPIGPAEQVPEAFGEFVRQCRSNGWGVAVLAGGEPATELYRANGLRRIYLGDEAILDPTGFSLEGKPIRKVRQSCHRLERAGYTLQFLRGDEVDRSLTQELEDISLSWRGETGERGFTMALGRLPSPRDPKCITAVARYSHGRAQAFLHVVPVFGSGPGASLDLMRRRPQTPNGLTEWMLAMTTIELGHLGIERFSMNFATFGRLLQEGAQLSKLERVGRWWVRRLNRFFQIESLLRFNEQLHPTWEPRFIYYEGVSALPRVALAYLEAESFLRVPLVGSRAELRRRLTQPEGHVLVEPI